MLPVAPRCVQTPHRARKHMPVRLTLFVCCSSQQAAPFIRCMGTDITLHTNRASSLPGPNCGSHGCLH